MNPTASLLRGGEWLLQSTDHASVLTPERLTDEHRLIARTVTDFVNQEVLPVLDRLEQKDWTLSRQLVQRAGKLGLLGADVAETDGGEGLDKVASMILSERMWRSGSFAVTFGAQANLMIPALSLFGTDAQKRKYLPKLLTGELIGAYCLSESGAGSDALGAKTRATLAQDGSFVLNGEKMWITNGGFADLFIVFAKIDGEHFTAFIVERAFPGVSSGHEERKMGLHGSSTTPVILQDVKVPAENLLGQAGKGHKIAFNVLNFARFKLGAACGGGARDATGEAARYAAERKQFGQPIASFGAIKHKLGEMVSRTYALESLLYRTAGMIDARIATASGDVKDKSGVLAAFEEYAIESSIAKVAGSEMLEFVLDENIQILGGNGYVSDYPAERCYRDSRVNRIFEGTNEINRLLIPGILARRASKGEAPIVAAAQALRQGAPSRETTSSAEQSSFADERRAVAAFKKASLLVFGVALQTYGEKLHDEQEVLLQIADMLIAVYASESAVLRASAASDGKLPLLPLHTAAVRVFVNDAVLRLEASGRQALAGMLDDEEARTTIDALHRLLEIGPVDTIALRRQLADETVARGAYPF